MKEIQRLTLSTVQTRLQEMPAVVLTGPRQVGKTTLALQIAQQQASIYLDLESPRDLNKLQDIDAFCDLHADKLIILDEVQRVPDLFAPLRGIIDRRRRAGRKTAQFLLLGSASISLLQQSSESLAGRISICEMGTVNLSEFTHQQGKTDTLWTRGGFPDSLLASSEDQSKRWRMDFIRTYLERDIPQLGPRIPAETLRRFWTMLAHNQGQLLNAASLARGLDVSGVTIARYVDLMVDLLLVRRLQPWHSNSGKRLIKAPKLYVRDSGICHTLLGIDDLDKLLGHPVVGGSWEGFVIEQIAQHAGENSTLSFYRSAGGAEIDLLLDTSDEGTWAIEIKRSQSPKISKGFHAACEDVRPSRKIVLHSGQDSYPLQHGVQAIALAEFLTSLRT